MHELLPRREARGREGRGAPGVRPLGVARWAAGFTGSLLGFLLPQGVTRLLLTTIPFFREVIVSSFSCEHCGWNNTEVQSAGRIQDQGVRYTLTVRAAEVRAWRGAGRAAGPGGVNPLRVHASLSPYKQNGAGAEADQVGGRPGEACGRALYIVEKAPREQDLGGGLAPRGQPGLMEGSLAFPGGHC